MAATAQPPLTEAQLKALAGLIDRALSAATLDDWPDLTKIMQTVHNQFRHRGLYRLAVSMGAMAAYGDAVGGHGDTVRADVVQAAATLGGRQREAAAQAAVFVASCAARDFTGCAAMFNRWLDDRQLWPLFELCQLAGSAARRGAGVAR